MNWGTTPEADADLIRGREWIESDNAEAAQSFLQAARECFDRLGQFPEMGAGANIKGRLFTAIRFMVLCRRSTAGLYSTASVSVLKSSAFFTAIETGDRNLGGFSDAPATSAVYFFSAFSFFSTFSTLGRTTIWQ